MATMKQDEHKIPRCHRVRSLRRMTGLSRQAFEKETGIPYTSLRNWELEKGQGLTEAGAQRMLKACRQLGIYASFEWLMYGIGNGPIQENAQSNAWRRNGAGEAHATKTAPFSVQIHQELELFYQHYKDAIHLRVEDDSMTPCFQQGDYVAGHRFYKEEIQHAVQQFCIVTTQQGHILLRYIKPSSLYDCYTLTATNYLSNSNYLFIPDTTLISAAPVIWIRKPCIVDS
jgi:transcriptional regulator with XRE-family HTH domain